MAATRGRDDAFDRAMPGWIPTASAIDLSADRVLPARQFAQKGRLLERDGSSRTMKPGTTVAG